MPEIAGVNVSRETLSDLQTYSDLLLKWNARINLVAKSTAEDIWTRHIVDSAQIMRLCPTTITTWVDIGSGGGFPGIVAAILLREMHPSASCTLIESDQRKCAFLRTVVRELDLNANVKAERAEVTTRQNADVMSARALMALTGLLEMGERHLSPQGTMLLHKGRTVQSEIADARRMWDFDVVGHTSLTDNESQILEVRNITRAVT